MNCYQGKEAHGNLQGSKCTCGIRSRVVQGKMSNAQAVFDRLFLIKYYKKDSNSEEKLLVCDQHLEAI